MVLELLNMPTSNATRHRYPDCARPQGTQGNTQCDTEKTENRAGCVEEEHVQGSRLPRPWPTWVAQESCLFLSLAIDDGFISGRTRGTSQGILCPSESGQFPRQY